MMLESDSFKEQAEKVIQPLKDQIDYRIKTPLIGSFVLSWLAFNWEKIAVLVISKENIYTRLESIANLPQVYLPLIKEHFTNTFILPLLSALFITVVVPFINRRIMMLMHNLNLKNIDTNVELAHRSSITTAEQKRIVENKNLEASEALYNSKLLKDEHEKLSKEVSTLRSDKEEIENDIDKLQVSVSNLKALNTGFENKYTSYKDAENKIESLSTANKDMTATVRNVQKQNNELIEEIAAKNKSLNDFSSQINKLQESNHHLTTDNEQLRHSEAFAKEQLHMVEESRFNEFSDAAEVMSYAEDSLKIYLDKLKNGTEIIPSLQDYRDLEEVLTFVTDKKNSLKESYWPVNKPFPERTVKERMSSHA